MDPGEREGMEELSDVKHSLSDTVADYTKRLHRHRVTYYDRNDSDPNAF